MVEQVPSIGRVVHYVTTNLTHYPADIASVSPEGHITLFVKDSGLGAAYFQYRVRFDPLAAPNTWHWPEYVPAKGEASF
jgi:hypothetical protein